MTDINNLITDNIDVWTSAIKKRNATGRGSSKKIELTGVKKLRELILELAVRGKLTHKGEYITTKVEDSHFNIGIPKHWQCEKLSDCTTATQGVQISKANQVFTEKKGYKRYLYISDFGEKYELKYVIDNYEKKNVSTDDLIMANTGATCGRVYLGKEGVLSNNLFKITFEPSIFYSYYLFYFLKSQLFLSGIGRFIKGGANPHMGHKTYGVQYVTIPPITEQHRIVAKVDELMALCDQLEQQTEQSLAAHQTLVEVLLSTLTASDSAENFQTSWQRIAEHFDVLFTTEYSIEQLKQTILQLAVMGKLVLQNPNDEPASMLLEKITVEKAQLIANKKIKKQKPLPAITDEEKPFELPSEWEWVRLGDVHRFLNGFAFKSEWFQDKGTKLLRNINIAHGETKWRETACIPKVMADEYSRFELEAGDIVISLDRPIINTGLKYAVIQTTDLPCLLLQRVAKFHSLADIVTPDFLSRWLESNLFMNSIDPGRSNGVPHISTKQLEMMAFPLCSASEQHRIVAKVDELMALCEQLKACLSNAQTTQLHLANAFVENALN
jgi:type I restriction enzyme S subunit